MSRFMAIVAAIVLNSILAAPAVSQQGPDPVTGTYSNGQLTITLRRAGASWSGEAMIAGQRYPVQLSGTPQRLDGAYSSADGRAYPMVAQLQGATLVVHVDGQLAHLQRQPPGQAAPQAAAPGTPQGALSTLGQAWDQRLRGMRLTQLSSYSSNTPGGGGYSSRRQLDLCANGSFVYYDSSTVSAPGGYSGGRGGSQGQWRIIERGGQVGLELRHADGNVGEHLLEASGNQTFVDRTRTFVTADNGSC